MGMTYEDLSAPDNESLEYVEQRVTYVVNELNRMLERPRSGLERAILRDRRRALLAWWSVFEGDIR